MKILEKGIVSIWCASSTNIGSQAVASRSNFIPLWVESFGDGLYYLIVDVVVHKDYQGKGIGKLLIEKIVKFVEDNTKEGQRASINLISMKDKEEFYEKFKLL